MERICVHIELDDEDFDALARGVVVIATPVDVPGAVRVRALARCLPGFDDPLPDPIQMASSAVPLPLDHPVWGDADVLICMHEVFDAQLAGEVTVAGRHEDVCIRTPQRPCAEARAAHRARTAVIAERERIAWERGSPARTHADAA